MCCACNSKNGHSKLISENNIIYMPKIQCFICPIKNILIKVKVNSVTKKCFQLLYSLLILKVII